MPQTFSEIISQNVFTIYNILLWKLGKLILENSLLENCLKVRTFCCESQDEVLTRCTLPTDLYYSSSISPGGHKL